MNLDNERKAFEAWAYSNKWNICRYPKSDYHMKEGRYCDDFVDGAWHGWLTSTNREGYKLVPLQPSNETIVAIERKVEEQLEASAIDADPFRLDGENIYKAMIGACDDYT